jgi:hypothetical protein
MTLGGRNAGGAGGDADRDARLDRLYRGTGSEGPPARLDAAILAAAHREVGARPRPLSSTLRRWRVPVSIAAVVVLSVSLVTLVQEEEIDRIPEIPPVASLPALEQMASPAAPAAALEPGREDRSAQLPPERAAAPAASAPAVADADVGRAREPFPGQREEPPPAAAGAPQPLAGAQALLEPLATPAPVPAARARDKAAAGIQGMPVEPPSGAAARRSATQAAQAQESPSAAALADSAAAGRILSSAPPAPGPSTAKPEPKPAPKAIAPSQRQSMKADDAALLQKPPIWSELERQPPEKWLERIEVLRQAGRTVESNDLLAEFRRRFPDHPLPAWAQ